MIDFETPLEFRIQYVLMKKKNRICNHLYSVFGVPLHRVTWTHFFWENDTSFGIDCIFLIRNKFRIIHSPLTNASISKQYQSIIGIGVGITKKKDLSSHSTKTTPTVEQSEKFNFNRSK